MRLIISKSASGAPLHEPWVLTHGVQLFYQPLARNFDPKIVTMVNKRLSRLTIIKFGVQEKVASQKSQ